MTDLQGSRMPESTIQLPVGDRPLPGPGRLRVAVVAESFTPGDPVRGQVVDTLGHLRLRGHDAVLICPHPAPESVAGAPVVTVPTARWAGRPVGLPTRAVMRTLAGFAPDVVHLAGPAVLGAAGLTAAGRLGVPAVAVQPPQPGGTPWALPARAWQRQLLGAADLTLTTSSRAMARLAAAGVPRVAFWGTGVDGDEYHPALRGGAEAQQVRARSAGKVLVGHALPGGSAELDLLATLPGVAVVELGAEPAGYAALDLFVRTTERGEGIAEQRALASGVPVLVPAAGGGRPDAFGYDPHRPGDLHRAVAEQVGDAHARHWAGLAARCGFERRRARVLGDALIAHYRDVISHSREVGPNLRLADRRGH